MADNRSHSFWWGVRMTCLHGKFFLFCFAIKVRAEPSRTKICWSDKCPKQSPITVQLCYFPQNLDQSVPSQHFLSYLSARLDRQMKMPWLQADDYVRLVCCLFSSNSYQACSTVDGSCAAMIIAPP